MEIKSVILKGDSIEVAFSNGAILEGSLGDEKPETFPAMEIGLVLFQPEDSDLINGDWELKSPEVRAQGYRDFGIELDALAYLLDEFGGKLETAEYHESSCWEIQVTGISYKDLVNKIKEKG